MKKNILVDTGKTRTYDKTVNHPAEYDENGTLTAEAWDETVTVTVPIYEAQTVDLTDAEQAELDAQQEAQYTASKTSSMTDAEKLNLILAQYSEDITNKGDDGEVLTKAVLDGNTIRYVDSGERMGTGTYDDPMQFVDGDAVQEGLYYCRCKVSAKGTLYRQLTSGTWKCLKSSLTATFPTSTNLTGYDPTAWEFVY